MLPVRQALHVRASLQAIAITSDFSLTDRQRFTIATLQPQAATICFPHEEIRDWTHTYSVTAVYNGDRHIQFQHGPVLVISALYAIF